MPVFLSRLLLDPRLRPASAALAVALYTCVIVAGSIPGARAEVGQFAPGVVLHGITYAALALLCFFGSAGSSRLRATKAVLAVALMGAGDELVQTFLPYRSGALHDWMIDVTAAVLTCTVLAVVIPSRDNTRPS
jgi:VanZ family protein